MRMSKRKVETPTPEKFDKTKMDNFLDSTTALNKHQVLRAQEDQRLELLRLKLEYFKAGLPFPSE